MTLEELIKEGEECIQNPALDNGWPKWINHTKQISFVNWERKSLMFLQQTYKSNPQVSDFEKIAKDNKYYLYDTAIKLISILRAFNDIQPAQIEIDYDSILAQIFNRFNTFANQLKRRYDGRDTIEISDEYDVQDLLQALFKLHFDDVRAEEATPSYAGGASRIDFFLKDREIAIEVKMARKTLKDKVIGEQLLIDIARYKEHPNCKTLYCFVYDPSYLIHNPTGLEKDLNKKSTPELQVKVFIRPTD
ncbi:hypothetical protein [Alistipes putredinis]|jgi:hypothetical protein|uniref:PD-(D/E)XK nuclease domain-containing protein n=1 Tax=Alistipes putredinis TaxID=28117 RepID=UPI003A92C1CB